MRILIKPLEPLLLRAPSSFTPMARGPATHGETLVYPIPSTITGVIASKTYWNRIVDGESIGSPKDLSSEVAIIIEYCREVLGSGSRLRPGFIIIRDRGSEDIYVVIGDKYIKLDLFMDVIREVLNRYINALYKVIVDGKGLGISYLDIVVTEIEEKVLWKLRGTEKGIISPLRHSRLGVSLHRNVKTIRTGFIYSITSLDLCASFYSTDTSIESFFAAEILGGKDDGKPEDIVSRFGGEGRLATVAIENKDIIYNKLDDRFRCIALIQLTPVILRDNIFSGGLDYTPLTLTKITRKLDKRVILAIGNLRPLINSRVSLLVPGYSIAMGRYRDPITAIIGNPIYIARGSSRDFYYNGMGLWTELGWGTFLPIRLDDENCNRCEKIVKYIKNIFKG